MLGRLGDILVFAGPAESAALKLVANGVLGDSLRRCAGRSPAARISACRATPSSTSSDARSSAGSSTAGATCWARGPPAGHLRRRRPGQGPRPARGRHRHRVGIACRRGHAAVGRRPRGRRRPQRDRCRDPDLAGWPTPASTCHPRWWSTRRCCARCTRTRSPTRPATRRTSTRPSCRPRTSRGTATASSSPGPSMSSAPCSPARPPTRPRAPAASSASTSAARSPPP